MRFVQLVAVAVSCAACSTTPTIHVRSAALPDGALAAEHALATPAPKQDPEAYGPGEGDSLLQLGGQISHESRSPGGDSDTVLLQSGLGYFVTEMWEVGGQVLGNWTFTDGADFGVLSLAPYANANFRLQRNLWLYAGPHLGLGVFFIDAGAFDDTSVAVEYGLHGGARFWVTPRASLFGEMRYTRAEADFDAGDVDIDTTQLLFGFNLVF
jgi:hypothetical protein